MLNLRWSTMNSLCEANPCHAKAKSLSNYPDLTIDWKKLYSLAFETTLYAKLKEFQYKILNLIIFTCLIKNLHQFKMEESPLCAFCSAEEESPVFGTM